MNRKQLLKIAIIDAGHITLKYLGKAKVAYTKKNATDVVTQADLDANKAIIKHIKTHFPNDSIISEENHPDITSSEYTWIIDPLDGTLNFSKHTPLYGVMIALAYKTKIIESGIYLPYFKELYLASDGKGTTLNGKKVKTSNFKTLKESTGVWGARWDHQKFPLVKKIEKHILPSYAWIWSLGSAAVSACYIADSRRDWGVIHGGGLWDYAATYLILKEAGCKVTLTDGSQFSTTHYGHLLAANAILHKELVKILNN